MNTGQSLKGIKRCKEAMDNIRSKGCHARGKKKKRLEKYEATEGVTYENDTRFY